MNDFSIWLREKFSFLRSNYLKNHIVSYSFQLFIPSDVLDMYTEFWQIGSLLHVQKRGKPVT